MKKDQVVAIIPARMASSRFPGKPLAPIATLPMVEHVRRRIGLSPAVREVFVATCDAEIRDTVERFGGRVVMTADTHPDCTDRVEEANRSVGAEIVAMVQGDEPLLDPGIVSALVEPLASDPTLLCTNVLSVITDEAELSDPDVVKAVVGVDGRVLYLSRAPIPWRRHDADLQMLRQTGLSAFRRRGLELYASLARTPLELREAVGFLRFLEHGVRVQGVISEAPTIGVDRTEDVGRVERVLREDDRESAMLHRIMSRG